MTFICEYVGGHPFEDTYAGSCHIQRTNVLVAACTAALQTYLTGEYHDISSYLLTQT